MCISYAGDNASGISCVLVFPDAKWNNANGLVRPINESEFWKRITRYNGGQSQEYFILNVVDEILNIDTQRRTIEYFIIILCYTHTYKHVRFFT